MNINLMAQALAVEITQNVQTTLPGDPSGAQGSEFEDMLVKQSQASKAQRREDAPKDKTAEKKTQETPEKTGTKDQEATEGQEVAAALVTSQPVVPLELVGREKMTVSAPEGPAVAPAQAEAAIWLDGTPLTQEQVLPETAQEVQPQTGEQAQVLPQEEQVQVQQPTVQPETEAPARQEAPELPQAEAQVQTREQSPVQSRERTAEPQSAKPQKDAEVQEARTEPQPLFRPNAAIPTKVGEVYEAREPEAVPVVDQLNVQIIQAVQQGQSTVQVQLSPANLGKVLVEITRGADGTISIVMSAATEKTAALLQQHSAGLQEVLANATQERVEVQVQQPQEDQNANMFLNPDGHNQQRDPQKQRDQEQKQQNDPAGFLQQLRLGLVELDGVNK